MLPRMFGLGSWGRRERPLQTELVSVVSHADDCLSCIGVVGLSAAKGCTDLFVPELRWPGGWCDVLPFLGGFSLPMMVIVGWRCSKW